MAKITLKDIADETGYSVSTVSRVLNGSNKISIPTRDAILKSAQHHNYRLPKEKNAENSTQLLNLALIATGFHEGEFYVSFFNGLNEAAKKNNIRLFLAGVSDLNGELTQLMKKITLSNYDGAIIFIPEFKQFDYEKLDAMVPSKFPVISNALIETPVFSTITFDSYSGGHLAARHFEDKKHTKVGVIKGPNVRAEARFRFNGFADYVNHHEEMELSWIYNGNFTFDSGHDAFEEFDGLEDKPTAIFACNDAMCNGFMEAAIHNEYNFPKEIAIMGYDNLPVCRHNRPTMSSINTDYEQLGMATMKLLREKLSNPDLETGMLSFVPVSITEREST
jgi:DNA-binding LacI/PurR family transcriptional regulator